jgi:hypothetical protein
VKSLDDVIRDGVEHADDAIKQDNYDPGNRQFRSIFVPIVTFSLITIAVFIAGIVFGLPYMFSVSYFALAITIVALIYDHWILNSVAVPISVIFIPILVADIFTGNVLPAIVHFPTAIIAFALITRHNTSLIVMLLTSTIFAAWVYTSCRWVIDPYYTMILWMMDPLLIALIALAGSVITSIVKTLVSYNLIRKRGLKVECDRGICPI